MASLTADLAAVQARLADVVPETERASLELRLGELYGRRGDLDQALLHLTAARRLFEHVADLRSACMADGLVAAACAVKGEHERAETYFQRAGQRANELHDEALAASLALEMAEAAALRDDRARALGDLRTAQAWFEQHPSGARLARIYTALALQAGEQGATAEAESWSERALAEAESAGDPLYLGRALLARGQARKLAGDLRGAKRFYRRAIHILQENELERDLAEAYLRYGLLVGEAYEQAPDVFTDPPAFWLAKSQTLFRELGFIRDLERVREAFRKYGRRATDKIAEVEVLQLLQELKQNRLEVQRQTQRVADQALASLEQVCAIREGLPAEVQAARDEITRAERALAAGVDQMALAEERFLGALNVVILERDNIRTLLDLCRSLNSVQDYGRLPLDISKMAAQLTGADRALVALLDEDGRPHVRGAVRVSDGDTGWRGFVETAVSRAGSPLLVAPPAADGDAHRAHPARAAELPAQGSPRLGIAMVCPLRMGEKVFGAIYVDKELCGGVFTERDLDLLAIFAAQVATILDNGRAAEELRLAARTRAATLEAITDGVVSFASSGRMTSINTTAARILGVAGGTPASLRLASFPDLVFLGGMMARGEEIDGRVVRLATGDYLLNTRCIRNDAGEIAGLVATLTEMKRATTLAQRIVGSTARFTFGDIIGNAPSLRRRLQLAEAAARSDSSVLVTGESGTGKELLAQAIHNASVRASAPFVGINCAAIPRELLESELFGYEAGAFTGAKKGGHPGKFELAEGGTILLDEIGDMPLEMQAKLLRVLQEKRVQRLGGTKEIPLNARLIATTNRDLSVEVERGAFRQDLFFRLRVIHIELPPLRERLEDIPLLVEHFLQLFSARLGRAVRNVSPEVLQVLRSYPWPGNIRELEHVLEGEVNLAADTQELLTEIPVMLEVGAHRRALAAPSAPLASGSSQPQPVVSIAESERQLLLSALGAHRGNIPEVAKALGVSRGTVYNKMRKFSINPTDFR